MAPTSTSTPVALITGSGRRLGRQIALALADKGFDIVINYRRSPREAYRAAEAVRTIGRSVLVVKADITRRSSVQVMMKRIIKHFGRLDVLVNNAAIFPRSATFVRVSDRTWSDVIGTNLYGTFVCAQEAARIMLRQHSGRIINIASMGGISAWAQHVPYSVSKAGVIMLTKAMARALAPNISVNAIAPGTIIVPNEEGNTVHQPPVERIPMRKYGKPSDISDMVCYLATNSEYMTGQIIVIDGGTTIP